ISYAQNFEDVMLWRALGSVEAGFYIDVGANHPEWDSVTKAFYDRGWTGINVEAEDQFYSLLCEERPNDINVSCFAGEAEEEVEFFSIPDSGLSTFRRDFADKHRKDGWKVVGAKVQVRTMDSILEEADVGDKTIHFLKIDVEGAEEKVLRGLSLDRYRPRVLLVEATEPNSPTESHADFEPLVLEKGYRFAYFDGLSRFYVADEHAGLMEAFRVPPNVFDDFESREQQSMREKLKEIEEAGGRIPLSLEKRSRLERKLGKKIDAIEKIIPLSGNQATGKLGRFTGLLSLSRRGVRQRLQSSLTSIKTILESELGIDLGNSGGPGRS
ncbi:MAG: FkbM family methyltransferase, partial [Verrucomicrobiota bacterium]